MSTDLKKNFILTISPTIIGGVRGLGSQQRRLLRVLSPRKLRWEETTSKLE
jgi:hypothetical protein